MMPMLTTTRRRDTSFVTALVDSASVAVFVNQSGYDQGGAKVATVTNTADGTVAAVKRTSGTVVATLTVTGGKVDFTDVDEPGTYRIVCNGAVSHDFRVGKYWNQRVSVPLALAFMNHARQDTFEVGASTGYAWRDSHQFSFELHGLVMQYAANPAVYTRMDHGIVYASTCEYADLRTQTEPDIVWLMKFAAHRYVDLATGGTELHALIKGQLPFFLWLYPHISEWVSATLYESVRDVAVAQWATTTTTLSWYDTGSSNSMFATQDTIGTAKGNEPPGHKILPNLLMWEVAVRDGLTGAQDYLDAAIANAAWLVGLDPTSALYTKGQRMSEHVTMTGLCHLYETYPEHAPAGTAAFIESWASKALARSANMWDFRMYTATVAGDAQNRWTNTSSFNEPGSIAGLPAPLLATKRVHTNATTRADLARLAQSQFDQVFGRNPFRRHYSYEAASEIEGVDVGYWTFDEGGYGALEEVPGRLDGSPPELAYPFDPAVFGYVEGWVAFNSAWNHALAYHAAEDVELSMLDPNTLAPVTSAAQGSTVLLRLRAPLNFDETVVESGWVEVSVDGAAATRVAVTETDADGWHFDAEWTVPAGSEFVVAYGYGLFRHEVAVTIT